MKCAKDVGLPDVSLEVFAMPVETGNEVLRGWKVDGDGEDAEGVEVSDGTPPTPLMDDILPPLDAMRLCLALRVASTSCGNIINDSINLALSKVCFDKHQGR